MKYKINIKYCLQTLSYEYDIIEKKTKKVVAHNYYKGYGPNNKIREGIMNMYKGILDFE
jgi:hypothetical protein